ncbi:MAG: polysaccharide pyruvyl transferase family protein [Armatimonadetes bacterium]|nr:polysaccharide pyruvyl transferase family protein [Armatimonadota bacterium]
MPRTIYLCGAGGKGNVGAEAIMLAIIKLFQSRYRDVRFILTSWYPERVRQLLSRIGGNFAAVRRESILSDPREIRQADFFVICGDVSMSETVVTFLPLHYGIRVLTARLLGTRTLLLGIEAEKIRKWYNLWAIKHLIGNQAVRYILRNEQSYENLRKLPVDPSTLLLGCEPSLMLPDSCCQGFEYGNGRLSGSKLRVGFGLRDHFTQPFRVNLLKGTLERRDASPGQIPVAMRRIIDFTARVGDYLVEKHSAQLIFIPHHHLEGKDRVIMTDREIAERVIGKMRAPRDVVLIEDHLHPFTVLDLYRKLDLAISMRHHTNSFACYHRVPTLGYGISEKMVNFFHQVGKEDMLLDPLSEDFEKVQERIDRAIGDREKISADLGHALGDLRSQMSSALDRALANA